MRKAIVGPVEWNFVSPWWWARAVGGEVRFAGEISNRRQSVAKREFALAFLSFWEVGQLAPPVESLGIGITQKFDRVSSRNLAAVFGFARQLRRGNEGFVACFAH